MPVIAIARCSELPDYEASVSLAGGTPWVVDHLTTRQEDVIGVANGLLLTGNRGVSPTRSTTRSSTKTGIGPS